MLRVRIVGNQEDRVNAVMQRAEIFEQAAGAMQGMSNPGLTFPARRGKISEVEALRILEEIDEARRRWGFHLYGIDTRDPRLYDLVIHLDRLSIVDAADLVCRVAGARQFQTTAESQQAIDDLLLAARAKAELVERYPRVNVTAEDGAVRIALEGGSAGDERTIHETVEKIRGVKKVDVNVYPFTTPD